MQVGYYRGGGAHLFVIGPNLFWLLANPIRPLASLRLPPHTAPTTTASSSSPTYPLSTSQALKLIEKGHLSD